MAGERYMFFNLKKNNSWVKRDKENTPISVW